jgi:hypothetical protein
MFQQDKHNLYITWKRKNSLLLCNQSFSFDTAEYPLHPEAVGFAMLTYMRSDVLNDLNADILCWFLLSSEQCWKAVSQHELPGDPNVSFHPLLEVKLVAQLKENKRKRSLLGLLQGRLSL